MIKQEYITYSEKNIYCPYSKTNEQQNKCLKIKRPEGQDNIHKK